MFKNIFSITYENNIYRTTDGHLKIKIFGININIRCKNRQVERNTKKEGKYIALIAPSGIGDFLFVKPFFKYIKKSEKYKNYKIILFQQQHQYKFSQKYNDNCIDEILIYNQNAMKLSRNIKKILKRYDIEMLVNLSARANTSSLKGDKAKIDLVKVVNAKEKVADVIKISEVDNKSFDVYTKLIYTIPFSFELERRKKFFEQLLDLKINNESIKIKPIFDFKKRYIIISLMAMNERRNLKNENWISILNYLIEKTKNEIDIVFIGSEIDFYNTEIIIEKLNNPSKCINICGQTDLTILPAILKNSLFLIAPETGTTHMAKAVDCKTICICSGAHYGRFLPHNDIVYIYPNIVLNQIKEGNIKSLNELYLPNGTETITDINMQNIYSIIDDFVEGV